MQRHCFICQTPIDACMGFVSASDFLKAFEEKIIPPSEIRETCGKCVNKPESLELLMTTNK